MPLPPDVTDIGLSCHHRKGYRKVLWRGWATHPRTDPGGSHDQQGLGGKQTGTGREAQVSTMQRGVELSQGQPVLVLRKQVSELPAAAFRLPPTSRSSCYSVKPEVDC